MTAAVCPSCSGERLPVHPLVDPLRFQHRPDCQLLAAEDSTRLADFDAVDVVGWEPRGTRPHERVLLVAVTGIDPDRIGRCIVTRMTTGGGVMRRSFLDVDGDPIEIDPEPTEETAP